MTDVNYFGDQTPVSASPKKNSGFVIGGVLLLLGFLWYFLSWKVTTGTNETATDTGSGYSETIAGGSSDATSEKQWWQTYNIRDGITDWWNGLFASGDASNTESTNDAMLKKLSGATVADGSAGNAAETLMAAMQKNPSAVTTVKLPAAMQAAIDRKTTSNNAYNALSAAMAKGGH